MSKVRWKGGITSVINERLIRNGRTALFASETWHRLYAPFVPMDTGMLAYNSVRKWSRGNIGYIHHQTPYASTIYNGDNFNFSTNKHHLASSRWDIQAHNAGRYKIMISDVQRFIDSGGR